MKLCAVSESLGHLSFEDAAKVSAELGLAGLEIGTGNWCAAPHASLESLLESKDNRREFLSVFERNGLSLGDAIHHVHAKDTFINKPAVDLTSRLETIGHENVIGSAWSYITLG